MSDDHVSRAEITEAFGWVAALIDGHRRHNGRDDALAMALLSAGVTLLLPKWGVRRVAQTAEHLVTENAVALMETTGGVQ